MKKTILVLAFAIFIVACSSKKEGNMIVQGTIKGLKKGTLYLQKIKDTLLISVDSVTVLGDNTFKLTDNIDSPIMYYLTFGNDTTNKRILFFGEKGIITINDNIDQFGFNPKISGSKNQEILDRFHTIRKGFQNQRLEFIKKDFEARKNKNDTLIKQLESEYKKMQKKSVLFTTNFAISNSDFEVAPYIGLTEMYDASLQMLDTVNKAMTDNIKNSVYGKQFQKYVEDIKAKEEK
ncbi:MAG: DUF4369 domain-containing protein [Polaribacter sp.]